MAARASRFLLVVVFAAGVGHLGWHARVGPRLAPDYFVGGRVPALSGTHPDKKLLYLRRKLHLAHRPRRAWLQVVGRDRVQLYVNGQHVASQVSDGFGVAVVADLAPYLQIGPNMIGIAAQQTSI